MKKIASRRENHVSAYVVYAGTRAALSHARYSDLGLNILSAMQS